jgi:hypothetical protein
MRLPYVKQPCKDCPFRKDSRKGWLGKERMEDILTSDSFVCHKNNSLQCAGHMILNQDNSFVGLANSLSLSLDLKRKETVFDTKKKCIDHHT